MNNSRVHILFILLNIFVSDILPLFLWTRLKISTLVEHNLNETGDSRNERER
jgi:hypothetical protein